MSNRKSNNMINIRWTTTSRFTDIEIESYIEENVCGLCRKVSKIPIKEGSEYFKTPTKCKKGSICAAAVFLEAMLRDDNSNTVANLLMKIVNLENS